MKQINNTGFNYYPKVFPNKPSKVQHNKATSLGNQNAFAEQLKQHTKELQILDQPSRIKLSSHAKLRLEQRGIELDQHQMFRLQQGMEQAKKKGAKESLLLMEGIAFVVSVKNETIITAMEQNGMTDQIITNIDSAVLL